ncbi:hypothetical protein Taro_014794 [Colocasia esculenta]|uniref:Uncharacterized protein n=1 Tax=Colocasia esculenta TaxID=4460 RepID=A0A843UKF1_COLES|nr:hypothetical protein [Colocasia esculenta]
MYFYNVLVGHNGYNGYEMTFLYSYPYAYEDVCYVDDYFACDQMEEGVSIENVDFGLESVLSKADSKVGIEKTDSEVGIPNADPFFHPLLPVTKLLTCAGNGGPKGQTNATRRPRSKAWEAEGPQGKLPDRRASARLPRR